MTSISKLPSDFNWIKYLELNKDMNIIHNEKNAIKHYLTYGINEKRIYKLDKHKIPYDFDWKEYLELNADLSNYSSKTDALTHYIKYGINEGREYKKLDNNLNNYDIDDSLNNEDDSLNDDDVLYTKQHSEIQNSEFLKYTTDIHILKSLVSFILVVDFNNCGGGTTIFLNRIISKYKKYNTFLILRFDGGKYYLNLNEEYSIDIELNNLSEIIKVIDEYKIKCKKIFVNHLLGFNDEFIKYIFDLDIKKIGITHDYYNIFDNPQPLFKILKDSKRNNLVDVNKYDILITQNRKNIRLFSKIFKNKIDIVQLPDYKSSKKKIVTQNELIICCIIGDINEIKGCQKLEKIIKYFNFHHKDIVFYIFGRCNNISGNQKSYNNIKEFNNLLVKCKPNLIIELTIWPETYSFTLTLSMLTNLPILYLKKPNNSVVKNRLKNYNKSYEFSNYDELYSLINENSQNYFYTINPIIFYNKYWNDLFIDKKEKLIENVKDKFIHDIKPYFIYFPQFHNIYENDINFYKGFDDMKNLKYFNDRTSNKKEIILKEYNDIDSYDYLLNSNLMQKQIDLIDHYGFSGLAIYYYWFTVNSYTNKNMIMDNVIDKFFDSNLNIHNKKIFFIWANEDWTNNISLSPLCNNKYNIKNIYNEVSFQKNSDNLIKYFKNVNYLKIDNKPVFYIYHTYLIDNIDEFYNILNKTCVENGFDGIHLVLNSFKRVYENFKNFYINFNYKVFDSRFTDKKKRIKLDYVKYMNNPFHVNENINQTVIFDFDNRARLCKPDHIKKATVCINNSEMNRTIFTKKIINTYDNENYGELDKILLVNALNEWGENMTFEPSDKYGYNNINLLHELL